MRYCLRIGITRLEGDRPLPLSDLIAVSESADGLEEVEACRRMLVDGEDEDIEGIDAGLQQLGRLQQFSRIRLDAI